VASLEREAQAAAAELARSDAEEAAKALRVANERLELERQARSLAQSRLEADRRTALATRERLRAERELASLEVRPFSPGVVKISVGVVAFTMIVYVAWPSHEATPPQGDSGYVSLKLDRELRLYPPAR
jgi:hypothetical protein